MKRIIEKALQKDKILKHLVSEKALLWKIFMLFLCIYVLAALAVEVVFSLPPEIVQLLKDIDYFVCLVFLADFAYKFFTAPRKLAYLRWGWIDFVSAIPFYQFLRIGRLAMIVNIIRLFRGVRSVKTIVEFIFINRAKGVLTTVGMISFIMIIFSSVSILSIEKSAPGANITTPEAALWWAITTVTTVGYGDHYPVTTLGRIIASGLMVTGVALVGTFTAYVATIFFSPEIENEEICSEKILEELKAIRKELEELKRKTNPPA